MSTTALDVSVLERLIAAATAAPSIHNTQPWKFHYVPETGTVEIRAATDRGLRHLDPTGRALHVSVGCAVLNLRVAVARHGHAPVTRLLPRPDRPDLLATVRLGRAARASSVPGLYDALWRRHSSRFPFSDRPLPGHLRASLTEAAHAEGAFLRFPEPQETSQVLLTTREAERRNTADADRAAESRHWVQAAEPSTVGMRASVLGLQDFLDRMPMRDFRAHRHPAVLAARPYERRPQIALLSTAHDRRADWLRAGQALEHVLLLATAHGTRASLLHQALEWPDLRAHLGSLTDERCGHPQMVIRLGYGPDGPASPRRAQWVAPEAGAGGGAPSSR
ncbi:nitroreductase family protein [Streptomyces sp. ID05-39B]|uniref:Acg family FMN-binding oxidoreductase n=1 Tax=Streptomyces sp. ID05-39B TaxID=3028664 RepID=UPI0029BAF69C|nr:nitroreductase family protein [Streptomyces sp. ID05-39B]MDX3524889.1 nitroreductase family protein [Streptomyces sp. ID05-39B]